ncbi:MAG: CPBP family glutamic-type intramembrane protease, partial [Chloroflexales bacterium]
AALRNHQPGLLALLDSSQLYFLSVWLPFGIVLLALALRAIIRSHGGDPHAFGATLTTRDLLLALVGLALGGAVFYFQAWRPLPPEAQRPGIVAHYVIWMLYPSIAESLVFMGVVFHAAEASARQLWRWPGGRIVGAVCGVLLSSVAFAVFHFSYPTPWNTWALVRTMFFVWVAVSSFYALTRSMPAALMFHTLLAVTGFVRNQQDVRSPDLLGLALNAVAIVVVVAILSTAATSSRALSRRQPA